MSMTEKALLTLVTFMKSRDQNVLTDIITKINQQPTLTTKCIIARSELSPQSNTIETICKKDLCIGNPVNETSGDGCKNGINYEIKASLHAKKSKFNFVQIRPDHNIHYYILISYDMFKDDNLGKAYIFKVPSEDMYKLVVKYGGYAHGTIKELGNITFENMKGRGCEYALRGIPNAKKGKQLEIWTELLKYEVSYDAKNF